jgi:hypothetical protein
MMLLIIKNETLIRYIGIEVYGFLNNALETILVCVWQIVTCFSLSILVWTSWNWSQF